LGSLPYCIRAGLKAAGSFARLDAQITVLLDMLLAIVEWAAFQKPFDWNARRRSGSCASRPMRAWPAGADRAGRMSTDELVSLIRLSQVET
jgi:hypothetical protein